MISLPVLWDEYHPAAARFYLGAYLADRKTKSSDATIDLARRYVQLLVAGEADATLGNCAVETVREVGRKFEVRRRHADQ